MKLTLINHCDINPYEIAEYEYPGTVPLPCPGDTIFDDDGIGWYVRDVHIRYYKNRVGVTISVSDEP